MTTTFFRWSASQREKLLSEATQEEFDMVIIGGGITGAGVAREASLAGLKVVLLEARDFASGTSSRSTKLFHGGLRYLERGEIRLVREGGREREGMQRLAPHLVQPTPFLLPTYRGMKYGHRTMGIAVWIYDWLAQVKRQERRKVLNVKDLAHLEESLVQEGLTGGVLYHEYQTDDARLTVTVIRSAIVLGAKAVNYAPVVSIGPYAGTTRMVVARDALTGREYSIRTRCVVNASGPWMESVRSLEGDHEESSNREPSILHSRGIHIVLPADRLPVHQACSFQSKDGRLVFVIPRGNVTFVGTTDDAYEGDLVHPPIYDSEVEYLLDLLNTYFTGGPYTDQDIIGQWAGVRPLVYEGGKDTKDVSRKDVVFITPSGMVSIAGGKLTAWRKMAQDVMALVHPFLDAKTPVNRISRQPMVERAVRLSPYLPLPGGHQVPPGGFDNWVVENVRRLCTQFGLGDDDARLLLRRYGDETDSVLRGATEDKRKRIQSNVPLLFCEIEYLVHYEMAVTLADIIIRRASLGWFGGTATVTSIRCIAQAMADVCGWSEEQREAEIMECCKESYWLERDLFTAFIRQEAMRTNH